jgi:hypothetical protein
MIRIPSRRTWFEWRLLAHATGAMTGVAVAVRFLPYAVWRRIGARRAPGSASASIEQVVRAVNGASCVVPGGRNCLVRAVTARWLLARHGHASDLVLGVAKGGSRGVQGHAWLRCDGSIVVGQYGMDDYTPMPGPGVDY